VSFFLALSELQICDVQQNFVPTEGLLRKPYLYLVQGPAHLSLPKYQIVTVSSIILLVTFSPRLYLIFRPPDYYFVPRGEILQGDQPQRSYLGTCHTTDIFRELRNTTAVLRSMLLIYGGHTSSSPS
jgi:hypothetical protein